MAKDAFRNLAGPPSKRKRIVTSCSHCRKKKVKCDKERPVCGVCLKSGTSSQCSYQEPSWENETKLGANYAIAASIPIAHIKVDSARRTSSAPPIQQNLKKQKPSSVESENSLAPSSQYDTQVARPLHSANNSVFEGVENHWQNTQFQGQSLQPLPSLPATTAAAASSSSSAPQGLNDQQAQTILPPIVQTYGPLPSNVRIPPASFTYGPNQPSIMGPPAPTTQAYNDNTYKLREKVQYTESNVRHGSPIPHVHHHQQRPTMATQSQPHQSQYMSFYDYHEPVQLRAGRLIASGPLSFNSLLRRDPFLRVMLLKIRKQKMIVTIPWKDRNTHSAELIKEIILEEKGVDNTRSKHIDEKFKATLIENEGLDEVRAKASGSLDYSRTDYETETILKIEEVLPEEKLVWILVDRFFDGILAAFLPFISEKTFREKIEQIIGPRKDVKEKITNIEITKRFDFAYVGELLIILRLSYLTVGKTSVNTPEEKYILSNPIGMNAVHVAQMCLNQFKLLRRGALPIIQCSLFMRFYHKFAPEDGDGNDGGDSQVFLGMLLQMANSIGLNRDLNNTDRLKSNTRIVHLWRIIWHEIVTLDLHQSLHMGNPILVDENYYDTLVPTFLSKYEDYTLKNYDIHTSVIKNFGLNDEINKLVRDFLKDILNINKLVKVDDLLPKLDRLESFINLHFQNLESIYEMSNNNIQDTIFKIYKFINYIELKTALFVIYYNLYLNNPTLNFSFLIKISEIAMEMVPLAYLMITTNNGKTNYFDSIFGSGSQLLLIPSIILSLQKVHKLLVGLITRSLDIKFNYPENKNLAALDEIRIELMKKLEVVLSGFQTLSSDYYQSWRFCKGAVFIYKLLSDLDNSVWDKTSKVNQECMDASVSDDVNHFKAIPTHNECTELSDDQIQQLYELVHTERFKEPLLKRLNKRVGTTSTSKNPPNSFPSANSDVPPQTTPPSGSATPYNRYDSTARQSIVTSGVPSSIPRSVGSESTASSSHDFNTSFYVAKNSMTDTEIDKIWFQMMANNTDNKHCADEGNTDKSKTAEVGLSNGNGICVGNGETNNGGMTHATVNEEDSNGSLQGISTLDQAYFSPFGSLDLERLIVDDSSYDVFDDIPFFTES